MKVIRILIECEVPDDFNDEDNLVQFIYGTMDNAPEPEDIDKTLKDVTIGFCYILKNQN